MRIDINYFISSFEDLNFGKRLFKCSEVLTWGWEMLRQVRADIIVSVDGDLPYGGYKPHK